MLDTIPHSDFWALQETHLPGIEHMEAAQRWARKRGWAAAFQGAEVVGQHNAANRGVCRAAAHQFERAEGVRVDAGRSGCFGARRCGASSALLAQSLSGKTHSRHAQTRRYVCRSSPRARRASLGAQSVAVGGVGCLHPVFRRPPGSLEPHDLSQVGWLDTVNSKVFAPSAATCAGGASAVLDYFVVSEAMAHFPPRHTGQSDSHSKPLLGVTESWPKPFPTEVPVGPQRQEEGVDWTRAAEEKPRRSGAGVAGVAARSRGCLVPHPRPPRSSAQALPGEEQRVVHWAHLLRPDYAQGHEEELQQKGRGVALPAPPGGTGGWQPGCLEEGADLAVDDTTVSSHDCLNLGGRPWSLGPRMQPGGVWADQVTRVMLFIKSQTQQAVNAAATDPARCWRQRAKEACQGSAGAGHAFSKTGIDGGEHGGLAAQELLVKWRHGCRCGLTGAGRPSSSWPTRVVGEILCQDLHLKKSTMFARHTRTQLAWDMTASTPRLLCTCQSNKATAGLLVRFQRRLAVSRCRQVCYLSLWAFGTILPGCSGAITAGKFLSSGNGAKVAAASVAQHHGRLKWLSLATVLRSAACMVSRSGVPSQTPVAHAKMTCR